jgi:hypothetical protein
MAPKKSKAAASPQKSTRASAKPASSSSPEKGRKTTSSSNKAASSSSANKASSSSSSSKAKDAGALAGGGVGGGFDPSSRRRSGGGDANAATGEMGLGGPPDDDVEYPDMVEIPSGLETISQIQSRVNKDYIEKIENIQDQIDSGTMRFANVLAAIRTSLEEKCVKICFEHQKQWEKKLNKMKKVVEKTKRSELEWSEREKQLEARLKALEKGGGLEALDELGQEGLDTKAKAEELAIQHVLEKQRAETAERDLEAIRKKLETAEASILKKQNEFRNSEEQLFKAESALKLETKKVKELEKAAKDINVKGEAGNNSSAGANGNRRSGAGGGNLSGGSLSGGNNDSNNLPDPNNSSEVKTNSTRKSGRRVSGIEHAMVVQEARRETSEKVNRAWMEKVEKLAETAEIEKKQIHENGQKLLYAREMERIKHFREMEGQYKQALKDLGDQYTKKAEWDSKKLKETENELDKIDGEVQRYVEMNMKKDVE